jgi:hypothetical protein
MDMATYTRESALNREAYERLRATIRSDFAGNYVALANGKLIGASPTFDEARALVESIKPVPEYYNVFFADDEPDFGLVYDFHGAGC